MSEKFRFKHMRSPAWCACSETSIYFRVFWITKEGEKEIGYIGCQDNDLGRGLCNNFCYKTFDDFRNKGLTKAYVKQFVSDKVLDLDCIRARTPRDKIASQKVLEYAGFENRGKRDDGKFGYTYHAF